MPCWCANIFGAKIMGTMFGAVAAFASLGMALGPWAGGLVYDTTHNYVWLHAGSFAIGLAAVAVALSFPSKRRADSSTSVAPRPEKGASPVLVIRALRPS